MSKRFNVVSESNKEIYDKLKSFQEFTQEDKDKFIKSCEAKTYDHPEHHSEYTITHQLEYQHPDDGSQPKAKIIGWTLEENTSPDGKWNPRSVHIEYHTGEWESYTTSKTGRKETFCNSKGDQGWYRYSNGGQVDIVFEPDDKMARSVLEITNEAIERNKNRSFSERETYKKERLQCKMEKKKERNQRTETLRKQISQSSTKK